MTPSLADVERILSTDIAYTLSRMKVLERLAGNPVQIGYRWIDDKAIALRARLPSFSRVIGLRGGHEHYLESLVQWYRDAGMKPSFEVVSGHHTPELGRELYRLGCFQSGFHASLIAAVPTPAAHADDKRVERVTTPSAMEDYLDAYVAGWAIPEDSRDVFKANVRPWLEQPGWTLYLARIEDEPAAAGTLFVHHRIAYLADATTVPRFRGRGLQRVLLRRRITDAGKFGADFVFSGAAPFSTSHRNMERVGMHVQFMRALWTPA